jgi:hypothetical protein
MVTNKQVRDPGWQALVILRRAVRTLRPDDRATWGRASFALTRYQFHTCLPQKKKLNGSGMTTIRFSFTEYCIA